MPRNKPKLHAQGIKRYFALGALLASLLSTPSCSDPFWEPPSVDIVKPVNGDTLTAPVAMEVKAEGSEVKSIQIYIDGQLFRSYPSTTVRDSLGLPSGGHILEASAKDEKFYRESRASVAFVVQ